MNLELAQGNICRTFPYAKISGTDAQETAATARLCDEAGRQISQSISAYSRESTTEKRIPRMRRA